ncbi:MAG: hypothetical protein IJE44_05075 [Clostridia bacterium]|nr:hypothetical protein [Clostridia bacterium]
MSLKEKFAQRDRRLNIAKNIIIVLLLVVTAVFFSFVLGSQGIGKDRAGATFGGTTVEEVFKNPSDIDDENITSAFWDYMSPEYIVVNKDGNRDILYSSTERYEKIAGPAMDIIKNMFGGITAQSVVTETSVWNNMLSVNSALMHFPAEISPVFPIQFLEISDSAVRESIDSFADILIVTGLPAQENALIYIKEAKTEEIIRCETNIPIKKLNDAIDKLDNVTDKNYAFGYELKLDSFGGNSTMLSSMLTIPLVEIETPQISAKVPENFSNRLLEVGQNELSRNVISIFGCDPNAIRSYVNNENSRVLLGDNRRIILSSDGIIEFKASGAKDGIDISGGTVQTAENSLYVAISGTLKTVLGMFEITGTDIKNADYEIKVTGMETTDDYQSEIRLCFDYYINGLIMEYVDNPSSHAIEAVISKGKLTYFKMELKNFQKTGQLISNEQMITAIDKYCAENQDKENIYIYDSYLYYGYKKNNETMHTSWAVN